jgi:HAD superfamily hydrolase (TIGR01662 family)
VDTLKFSVVLFDLGATLLYFDGSREDWVPQANLRLFQALVGLGYMLDPLSFIPAFQTGLDDYFKQRDVDFLEHTVEAVLRLTLSGAGYLDVPQAHLKAALRQMYAVTQAHWQLEPDALSMLQELKSRGCRLGLISNAADGDDVRTLLVNHDLAGWFELVLVSAEVGCRKPLPCIFQQALDFFQVTPAQAVMVGDKLGADILGARNAGMASIWITRRANRSDNRAHLDTILPDRTIATLAELPDLLAHW